MKNKKTGIALMVASVIAVLGIIVAVLLANEDRRKKAEKTLKELWGKAEKNVKKVEAAVKKAVSKKKKKK